MADIVKDGNMPIGRIAGRKGKINRRYTMTAWHFIFGESTSGTKIDELTAIGTR